jgi:polar amino acid transport system substrate-binding protein
MPEERKRRRHGWSARHRARASAGLLAVLAAGGSLAACGSSSSAAATSTTEKKSTTTSSASAAKALNGSNFTVVIPGANPPYWIPHGTSYTGAGADLMEALGKVLHVHVHFVAINEIPAAVAAISDKRYQMAFAPYGDTSGGMITHRQGVTYVDVVQEIVPFLVRKGNPANIHDLGLDLCGKVIAAEVNGAAYNDLVAEEKSCKAAGKPPVQPLGVQSVPDGVLTVKSGRAVAFFASGAALFYYTSRSHGALEVVGTHHANGFRNLFQGAVLPAGSPLTNVVLDGFKKLFADGQYKAIMEKWGLDREILNGEPGIDLAKKAASGS